jgi:type VI secretion system protein ImpH
VQSVEERLFAEPFSFDFFQAVRLLERLMPDRGLIGRATTPTRELVRFRVSPSLFFPPSSIFDLAKPSTNLPMPLMTVLFFGLHGPSGVLPRHYTELIIRLERDRRGEERRAFRDWLDVFNHRLISLFQRAWEKYRFWIPYERGELDKEEPDTFTQLLYSFIGLGTSGLRDRLKITVQESPTEKPRTLAKIEDISLIYFAGLLAERKRNAAGLERLLSEYFAVTVRVKQFAEQWLLLEPSSQSRLGVLEGNSRLGQDTVLGERVRDVQSKIRLIVGPLDWKMFLEFLPDHSATPEHKSFLLLVHLARFYIGNELDFDVQLILKAAEVPECCLNDEQPGPRLGWNTWLVSQQPMQDADQAIFQADEVARLDEGILRL